MDKEVFVSALYFIEPYGHWMIDYETYNLITWNNIYNIEEIKTLIKYYLNKYSNKRYVIRKLSIDVSLIKGLKVIDKGPYWLIISII
jgi:hypothetical protein